MNAIILGNGNFTDLADVRSVSLASIDRYSLDAEVRTFVHDEETNSLRLADDLFRLPTAVELTYSSFEAVGKPADMEVTVTVDGVVREVFYCTVQQAPAHLIIAHVEKGSEYSYELAIPPGLKTLVQIIP